MKPILLLPFLFFSCLSLQTEQQVADTAGPPASFRYQDPNAPVADRVKDLMARMSLEDKTAQMAQYVGLEHMKKAEKDMTEEEMAASDAQGFYPGMFSKDVAELTRQGKIGSFLHVVTAEEANYLQRLAQESPLKIPLLIGIDAIHGNGLYYGATIYPSPIGQAAAWNDEAAYEMARQTALEMRVTGTHWAFTPNIDVLRDPRWGRSGETFGEDPYLVGNLGIATIKGFQTDDFTGDDKVIACVKHLIAGSQSVNGLNSAPTDVSDRTLFEVYLPPYRRAIEEANVYSIMAAHNEIAGVPCHMDKRMMTAILRDRWNFDGFYVSDWNDVSRIATLHHVAEDYAEASRLSVDAGLDMNMHGPQFQDFIATAVKNGTLSEARVNEACAKILTAKFKLGLFENPFVEEDAASRVVFAPAHRALALEGARQSITLLKNGGVLPLQGSEKNILVLGPNADNMTTMGDWVSPQPEENLVTVLEGMQELAGKKGHTLDYFEVADRSKKITDQQIEGAVEATKRADVAVLVLGENSFRHDWPNKTTGENIDRATLQLSGRQLELAKAVAEAGKPIVAIYVSGSPISEPWLERNAAAVLSAWEPGSFGGQAIAEVLFGDYNPGGKLPVTVPQDVGQLQMVYNHKPSTYKHKYNTMSKKPLYSFGFGLSYTTYEYGQPRLSAANWNGEGSITVSVDVTNSGKVAGTEIAQLYIRDEKSQVTRPVMELKGYQRVPLAPGETKTVTMELTPDHLAYYNLAMEYVVEPGDFTIMTGSSSRKQDLKKTTLTVSRQINLVP